MSGRFDSHLHFNLSVQDPVENILEQLHLNGLDGAVLILNTDAEKNIYRRNFARLTQSTLRLHPATLIAPRSAKKDLDFVNFLISNGVDYSLKLHSRLSKFEIGDLPEILEMVDKIPCTRIIVDGFYYGENLENQIHMELALALAKRFPKRTIIYAHSGGIKILETLVHMRPATNIYYDLSLSVNYLLGTSAWHDLAHFLHFNYNRIFFGSDYPDFPIAEAITATHKLLKESRLENIKVEDLIFGAKPYFGEAK